MDRRILFAEFMGWIKLRDMWRWYHDDHNFSVPGNELPDPENNDTDCMALKRAVIDAGWMWEETHYPVSDVSSGGVYFHLCDEDTGESWRGECDLDMWRHGVCDLAEPIIREAMKDA